MNKKYVEWVNNFDGDFLRCCEICLAVSQEICNFAGLKYIMCIYYRKINIIPINNRLQKL